MTVAHTRAVALQGLRGGIVDVEASISAGLASFAVIGLPDTSLREASARVMAAARSAGTPISSEHVVVNLSPASLPKQGSAFDLAIAVACLAAAGLVSAASVASSAHLGELGLDGRLRPVPGILPAVHAAAAAGIARVFVPSANAEEAALVPGIAVVPVASLREAAIRHGAALEAVPVEPLPAAAAVPAEGAEPDLAEVIGNELAVEALIAAAAGGHHLYFTGPPGGGKTMLAQRLPGILPDLDERSSLEVSSIRSLGQTGGLSRLVTRPPFEAPHHTASAVALVGGGSGRIRPGAAVRASSGVLFLDEAPEFRREALDALRQPLESGVVSIARAQAVAEFPARFQLVLAANPCPCGFYGSQDRECVCKPSSRLAYIGRLSGPLLDRVDIRVGVQRMTTQQLTLAESTAPVTTATARQRVAEARAAAAERLSGTPWRLNGELPASWLRDRRHRLARAALVELEQAYDRGRLSLRGYHRALRLAWTLADLAGHGSPGAEEVGAAVGLRGGAAAA